ncbi:ATP-binding protein [Streptomyces sp. NPDC048290]|uniref:ATP-binding protein n=1 Tax=Streptomyces sp. NPDC048290 TaxID=3155811 RepID=UPI00343A69B4
MRVRGRSFFLVRDPSSVPLSRRRLRDLITQWDLHLDEDSETALITTTSELVTNGVVHGTGTVLTVGVHADLGRRRVLIEVYDDSLALPHRRAAGLYAESGRGLLLIDQLAIRHGAERAGLGKRVWAEIAIPRQPRTRHRLGFRPCQAARSVARRLSAPLRPPTYPPGKAA